ncbi:protocadherin alpha-3-like isoform X3 [Platichthys flesus]|uniref:protocadherin alpha-3-like isoform X3 n=1 Tax=Platichthys flesus TaxID=8260 RepID=UPI002DB7EC99|nr:protocadherin alpha-3-like isoform X3 [Platichthys flesus]
MEQRRREPGRAHGCLVSCLVAVLLWSVAAAQIRYSISEEVNEGTVVGNVAKDLGLDKNTLRERKYRIVSSNADPLFHVNQNDGILYVSRKIDREEVCERTSTCIMNLKTVLENPLEVHYVGVEVLDINDNFPSFPDELKIMEISESVLPGVRIPLQPARDADGGPFSVQQYKLSSNDQFRLEVKDKGEDGKIPVLIVLKPLDRENAEKHSLVLTALDGGKPPKSGEMNIIMNVLDVNDNTPSFTKEVYSVMLDENAVVGTTVLQVNATDLDEGPNGDVVYSFSNSVNRKLFKLFEINPSTGQITVKGLIDYEDKDKYEIEIQASDKGLAPLATQKSVIIKIVDVNDNTPEIEVTSFSSSIPEDSRPGTTVALISVNDLDSGLNGKVICSIVENVPFTLSPSLQDKMYSLVTKSPLDREKLSHYDLTITAKDAGQPPLSSEKTISVVVSDVNDNSPQFSLSPYTFYVTESNNPGTSVFSVKAFDADENENAHISYHILRDGSKDNKLTSFLNINSENGDIMALKSFDFETVKTFQFNVVASDSGTPSLSSNVTVNVFILDQNDNAPVILYPVSSNGSAEGVEEIPRNVNAGHLVTKVRAYDADIGYNGWLLFSLQEVTDHSLFGLDRYTGQIRTLRSFTETDEAEHKLLILVKDNGNVSLSATATVIIKVVEPKEAFAASDVKSSTKADEDNNVTFYLMITLGSVSALFLVSIIVLISMQCSKSTDYTSKYLPEPNYDGTLCHSIQYRSGDKRYMLVGPRMSIGSTIAPGSHANTLMLPDRRGISGESGSRMSIGSTLGPGSRANTLMLPDRRGMSGEPKAPNADWRYSASLRAGGVMQSSVHMEESSVMQGAQGVLVQNWPTASSAAARYVTLHRASAQLDDGLARQDAEGGEVSPPMGAGVDSNSWHFRYGPGGPGAPPQHLKPGEVPPEAFIIPGSPAIISIRQNQGGEDDKSDFITFGKKEEAKKKKKKKKEKKDKKDKGKDDDE